jgi:hypothetical protein
MFNNDIILEDSLLVKKQCFSLYEEEENHLVRRRANVG